jgi:hypothetical protein
MMEKVIAFLFSVLYLVFTTLTWWQVNDEDGGFRHTAHASHESIVATFDDGLKKAANNDIRADQSLNKAPQHLTASGKRNLLRASSVILAFSNLLSCSTAGYYKPSRRTAAPLMYQAAVYLKNGVLRI